MVISLFGRPHRKIEAILFDLDGLLADTEELHVMAYEVVAKRTGINMNREYIQSFIGRSTKENIWQIIDDFHITEYSFDELLRIRFESYYEVINTVPVKPMKGALNCIEKVRAKNLKLALVTLSMREHALSVLENISKNLMYKSGGGDHSLTDFFDEMVFGNEIHNPKPEPDIYLEALKRLQTPPDSCIALEDSEAGVISAKRAGLTVIAVPNEHTKSHDFQMADWICTSLYEVAEMEFLN
jgi:beta-phosphoglucomutase-like phosphatase (HAD superfamily)